MGSLCCCFHVPDVEENANSNGSNDRNCICLNCFIQSLTNKYGALFGRREMHAVPSSDQERASSNSAMALNNTPETNSAHRIPLPNNLNSRNLHLQQDVVVTRHEKGTGHSRVEPEPLGRNIVQVSLKCLSGDKLLGCYCEGGSKDCLSETSAKVISEKVESGVGYVYASSEEEDVCPTCLEEYTPENPKIITQCSHHYHLGCIYEWMERSECCPVCGKVLFLKSSLPTPTSSATSPTTLTGRPLDLNGEIDLYIYTYT